MTPADRHLLATLVATVQTIARTPADRPCVQAAAGRLDAAAEAVEAEARGPDIVDMLADLALASDGYTHGHAVEARRQTLREAVTRARMLRGNGAAAADHEAWLDGEVAFFAGETTDATPSAPGPIGSAAPDKPMVREPWEAIQRRAMEALAAHIAHPAHQSLADGVSGPGCPGVAGGAQAPVEPAWRDWETDPPPERVAIEVRRDGLVLWRVVGVDSADGSGEVERL